jgi:hypothetical protein
MHGGTMPKHENFHLRYDKGLDWDLPCFVSNDKFEPRSNLKVTVSGIVDSNDAGERVVDMFDELALLVRDDIRGQKPSVKIGVSKQFELALEILANKVRATQKISRDMIQDAIKEYCRQTSIGYRTKIIPEVSIPEIHIG